MRNALATPWAAALAVLFVAPAIASGQATAVGDEGTANQAVPERAPPPSLEGTTATRAASPSVEEVAAIRVDDNGDGVPDRLGATATVVGHLTTDPFVVDDSSTRAYLQDDSGGLRLTWGTSSGLPTVGVGDLVRVSGRIDQHSGTTTLIVASVVRLERSVHPTPRVAAVAELHGERLEGQLVEVRGRLRVGAAVELLDESGEVKLSLGRRLLADPRFRSEVGDGREVVVVGILEQLDASAPFTEGYCIFARDRADIAFVPGPPWPLLIAVIAAAVLAITSLALWGFVHRQRARAGAALLEQRNEILARQRDFLAEASHQIRTPLTVLRGSIEVALLRRRSETEYRAIMRNTLEDVKGVTDLTNDLIALARTDERVSTTETARTDLARLVEEVAGTFRARAHPATAGIGVVTDTPLWVDVDPVLIRRAFSNVLDNAVKYGGGEPVLVHARRGTDGRVEVEVADRGPGVAENERENIFRRFYRSTGRADVPGTGLGLPIARAIMEQHGGGLDIEDREGGGTSFLLWLEALPPSKSKTAADRAQERRLVGGEPSTALRPT